MLNNSPFFSIGFRPFFFLAALIGMINPPMWASYLYKNFDFPLNVDHMYWHGHEMTFAFTSALIAGFILTASANWTGTSPYKGKPLALLSLLWLFERISYFLLTEPLSLTIATNIFYPVLIFLLFLKLKDHPKQKYVFLPLLGLIYLASLLHSIGYFYEQDILESYSLDSGISLIRLLTLLILGRVLPFFTRMKIGIERSSRPIINQLSLITLILVSAPIPFKSAIALTAIIAFVFNFIRQIQLFDLKVLKVPMLWVLHMGMLMLNLSLLAKALAYFFPDLDGNREIYHITMIGGLGVTALGIMTRVSLGHTGRAIKANKWVVAAYLSLIATVIFRVFIPHLFPNIYEVSVYSSSKLWALGFMIYLGAFTKILFTTRADEK